MKNGKKMKLVVASGKGGVGKSMFASTLAMMLAKKWKLAAVDCDVDAPNLHLWLGEDEKWDRVEKIATNELAAIDRKKCDLCGRCVEMCAFEALKIERKKVVVNEFFCEGCGACEAVCLQKAISMKRVENAKVRVKENVWGFFLVSGQIYPGQTGSGKVVEEIKKRAEKYKFEVMVLDSAAGIGCPVIASINGSDFSILITEPTLSGLSDLKRVLKVVKHFKIPFGVVINKWDINKRIAKKIKEEFKDSFLGEISYDKRIFKAISNLMPILETKLKTKEEIKKIVKKIERKVLKSG